MAFIHTHPQTIAVPTQPTTALVWFKRRPPLLVRVCSLVQVLAQLQTEMQAHGRSGGPLTRLLSHEETGPGWSYTCAEHHAQGKRTSRPITSRRFIHMKNDFKGNKQSLPSKLCAVCGRTMTWRKAWAKNWETVLYCSDACRAKKPGKTTS